MGKISTIMGLTVGLLFVAGLSFGNITYGRDPATLTDGHVWFLDDMEATDSSPNGLNGNIIGDPTLVSSPNGLAMQFDGIDDGIHIPDSEFINVTNGPWPSRTIMATFNCADALKPEMQTVFEEGGRTRGITIYVHDGEVYVGAWNRAEYNWNGAWLSAPIGSNEWHAVALIIRNGDEAVEDDKFEMWMDGQLVAKAPGGRIHNHSNDNSIGYTKENNVFHDDSGDGDGFYFEGMIEEVWIFNEALPEAELAEILTSVEPASKLSTSWGTIKTFK